MSEPPLIEIDGRRYLWSDILTLRRMQLAKAKPMPDRTLLEELAEIPLPEAPDVSRVMPEACFQHEVRLHTYKIHYQQTSIREIVVNAHDAEEAIARANMDLFTPRDTSLLAACYLGSFRAKRMTD